MAASVEVVYKSGVDVTERFDTSTTAGGKTTFPFASTVKLGAATSPAASEAGYCTQAMTAGAATIDLTSVATSRGRTMTYSGLKIRAIRLYNPSTNASITVAKGASNGYTGFGSAFSIVLRPGYEVTIYDGGNGVAVSGSVKTLDISGTGSEVLQFAISGGA